MSPKAEGAKTSGEQAPRDEVGPGAELEPASSLISHLVELRNRILWAVIAVLVLFLPLAPFSGKLFTLLAQPLLVHLPEGTSMIATQVASPFLTPFKLTLFVALFLAMPMVLYQLWAFVAPGLYSQERRLVMPLMVSSTLLFYSGVAFAYFAVFPLMFGFFNAVAPEGVSVMTDINAYLDFVLAIFFAFGLAFEVPVATVLLVSVGLVMPSQLKQWRAYVFVGAFVIGMLLTPPDVISQTLLAVPMYLLYEAGIFLSGRMVPGVREADAMRNQEGEGPSATS
ncbi:MAG: twin-arginine translocase subunit TatC [Pseudomonadota bacterium]